MVGNKSYSHSILQVLATKLVIKREIVSQWNKTILVLYYNSRGDETCKSLFIKAPIPRLMKVQKKRIDKYKLKNIKGYNIMLVACKKPMV